MKKKKSQNLKVLPLGGVDEIGKNMTVLEYGQDIIVVDCGSTFPNEEMLGIDLVIPDITYLEKNRERIRGIVLTHGHEDHIGALPYVLKRLNVPVYATQLTLGLVDVKLQEEGITGARLNVIQPRDRVRLGCFEVEFIKISHSIQGSVALAIHTPIGVVFMTGDFKVDYTPVDGKVMDFARIAALGEEGVLLLMADSTNVERPGYTLSEKVVGENLDPFFRDAKGRVIITTFSSNVHRIQQIIDIAARYNRKICFSGRSMVRVSDVARELGLLKVDSRHIVDASEIKSVPDKRLVVITTGSQGEPMSGLMRMAHQNHAQINIKEGDTVILSATPVPGNEKMVNRLINQLFRCGANVIYSSLADIHVSGHACREELKLLHSLIKPQYFVPVHGEYRHLRQHILLAQQLGMKPKQTKIPQLGHEIIINGNGLSDGEIQSAGAVLVDGLGIGDVGAVVLRDRHILSQDGIVVVTMTVDGSTGQVLGDPDIITRGFVYVKENDDLIEESKQVVLELAERQKHNTDGEWTMLKAQIRTGLSKYFYECTRRSPMILPVIVEI